MKFRFLIVLGFLALLVLPNVSCDKKTDCTARIICKDSLDQVMPNAVVKLFANVKTATGGTVTADLKAEGITDAGGQIQFIFKLPAIYDIKATNGKLVGIGIIKLEEGKLTEKNVIVR